MTAKGTSDTKGHAETRADLGIHFVGFVLRGKIEADRISEVNIHLIHQLVLFTMLTCNHNT